jgi:hypothetical protein
MEGVYVANYYENTRELEAYERARSESTAILRYRENRILQRMAPVSGEPIVARRCVPSSRATMVEPGNASISSARCNFHDFAPAGRASASAALGHAYFAPFEPAKHQDPPVHPDFNFNFESLEFLVSCGKDRLSLQRTFRRCCP